MDLLADLAGFGVPGLLVVTAFLFWEKSRDLARLSLVFGIVGAVAMLVLQLIQLWPAQYQVKLEPPPRVRWGGFLKSGQPVEEVKATLIKNGKEHGAPVLVDKLDLSGRQLEAKDGSNELEVTYNTYPQGTIAHKILRELHWSLSTGVAIRSPALTGRVKSIEESTTVKAESAFREQYGALKVHLTA